MAWGSLKLLAVSHFPRAQPLKEKSAVTVRNARAGAFEG